MGINGKYKGRFKGALLAVFRPGLIRTLMVWFILIALVPLTVVSSIGYFQAKDSLRNSIVETQRTTIALKTAFIDNWFSYRFLDLKTQSTSLENTRFLEKLREALQTSGKEAADFVGSSRWASIVEEYSTDLRAFRRTYAYYDVFLIDLDGNILFTDIGEPDLGTNLFSGPYSGTLFARACKQALKSGHPTFSDFEFYAPSNNAVAGFLISSIIDENAERIGLFALQIPIDKIDAIMQDRTGMGKTGETFLVGVDLTLRSNSAQHDDEKILSKRVETEQTQKWYREHITENAGKETESLFVYPSHRGKNVLGTHHLVEIAGVKWGLIAEIEEDEVFASITRIRMVVLMLVVTTGVIVLLAASMISRRIINPLLSLTATAEQIQAGHRDARVAVSSGDEIEQLAKMFNSMLDSLNEALAETETARDRIDGILKSIGDGLIVTDLNNRVLMMNRAAEDMLGVQLSDVVDLPIEFAVEENTLRESIVVTLNKQSTGYAFDFDLPDPKAKYPRIMRARTAVIFDREGRQTGIVTIIHDVTHEREVDRMKTEFISTAAHELRTPLTSIQGFSEILMTREDLDEQEKARFLGHINQQAAALTDIINDLLDISRIESGRGFALNLEECDAGAAIKMVVEPFITQAPQHKFKVNLPGKSHIMIVDKDKMTQVLENIIGNAVKYSPDGGEIRVSGITRDDRYVVTVEDQGLGMTPDQLEQMFDKFYRADSSDTAIEGTGLGMSIVKAIIDAHKGEVRVESEYGTGTKVTIWLPLPIAHPVEDVGNGVA